MELAYLAESLTPAEISAEDPFGGQGTRIDIADDRTREDIAGLIGREHPGRPFVIFESCAWIGPGQ